MMYDGNWTAGQWVVMMLIFWGGLAALVVWLVRVLPTQGRVPTTPASPAPPRGTDGVVLAERFARGEIDEEEFARRSKVPHSG
jgi:putative membrane protein